MSSHLDPGGLDSRRARAGVLYGAAAYAWWGLCPIYFKVVASVPALEVLAHRVVWSALLLAILIVLRGRLKTAVAVLRNRRTALTLLGTAALIACNWLIFIYAVAHDELLQAGLGYFINPLVSVLLGFVFLGERLRRWQKISVVLAAFGVGYLILAGGEVPFLGLTLAFLFGFYGLIRKKAPVDALTGLTIETLILSPAALVYLIYISTTGLGVFGGADSSINMLLASAGVITALPLLWFANAAHRLRLSTLGFLQYIAPTGQVLLACLAYGEPFTADHLIAFSAIWTALAIYSIDMVRSSGQRCQ